MPDISDMEFAGALEHAIIQLLSGNEDVGPGLFRLLVNAQTWDEANRLKGQIVGLERVLEEMRNIAKRMNADEAVREQQSMARSMN